MNGQCQCDAGFSRCDSNSCKTDQKCIEAYFESYCGAKGDGNNPDKTSEDWWGTKCGTIESCTNIGETTNYECECKGLVLKDIGCIDPKLNQNYCGAKSQTDLGVNCTVNGFEISCDNGRCKCQGENLKFVAIQPNDNMYITDWDEIKSLWQDALEGTSNNIQFTCVNTKYDKQCCGNSCRLCDGKKVCDNGTCASTCPDGFINCSDVCRNGTKEHLKRADGEPDGGPCTCIDNYCLVNEGQSIVCEKKGSPKHCGECNNACPDSYTCEVNTCACIDDAQNECSFEAFTYNNNAESIQRCLNKDLSSLHLKFKEGACASSDLGFTCHRPYVENTKYCYSCEDNWGNLDGDWSNGCESDLSDNASHCGIVGNNCYTNIKNASGVRCINSQCAYTVCNQDNLLDCNGDSIINNIYKTGDGCETDIATTLEHCGACGHQYPADSHCKNGQCCYEKNENIYASPSEFVCCEGQKRVQYKHAWLLCPQADHYGCIDQNDSIKSNCWHEE